jgi:hypothetical protein
VCSSDLPWTYKPEACWLHPLRWENGRLVPPPRSQARDPDATEGYPGYSTYTPCGRHRPDGRVWSEVLREELAWARRKPRGGA